ncbi:MAG: hypothetical protein ABI823_10680, partial [Bryobacteraceae bacterium]
GDANIGPRLPALLTAAGFERVEIGVAQPIAMDGDAKLMVPLTFENIADAVAAEGLATPVELDTLLSDLYEFAAMPGSVVSVPRIIESWGYAPA